MGAFRRIAASCCAASGTHMHTKSTECFIIVRLKEDHGCQSMHGMHEIQALEISCRAGAACSAIYLCGSCGNSKMDGMLHCMSTVFLYIPCSPSHLHPNLKPVARSRSAFLRRDGSNKTSDITPTATASTHILVASECERQFQIR